ncbi:hypothetical protein IV203_034280 [Nitzschia inconspicua]|uniref:Uncharacterized protein n=1 Tax=Nitzschia inconspicua TaxID=303405 RepID=A0A9K3Q7G8_9STRA|nr:hypothetical protein IV203_034280 [Nitzschia inconspicua]
MLTAKSVMLLKSLALLLLLWPLQRKRLELQRIIETRLKDIHKIDTTVANCSNSSSSSSTITTGFWSHAMQTEHGYDDSDDSASKIAELIVGLLYAAHKNPAMGASQSFLFLQQELDHTQKEHCPSFLRRVCLESLRVTAHSIGAVRTVQKDVTVNNNNNTTVHIPEGSYLAFSHIIPNIAPSIWGGSSDETTPAATNTSPAVLFGTIRCVCIKTNILLQPFPTVSTNVPDNELVLQLMVGVVALLLVE